MGVRPLLIRLARAVGALCLALAFCLPARAQPEPGAAASARPLPPTATFSHLTIDQGLADQIATEITQDAEGFMWFGTFNGLDRYDGYRFVHYRHDDADPHSLSGNVITALYTDGAGSVWVGSRGAGLSRFDPRTQEFQVFRHDPADPSSLSSDSPHMVYQDRAGTLWIASEGGLSRFSPETGTFTNYTHIEGDASTIASNAVRSIAEDGAGALWLGTAGGLTRFDPRTGVATNYRHSDADPTSLAANSTWKVLVDHVGRIWAATDNGLDSLAPNTGQFTHYQHDASDPHSLSANPLDALLEDTTGRIWVGTFGGGVSILDPERTAFTNYSHDSGDPSSLSYDQVDKIFQDRSGLIWLGTGGGGIEMYNPQQQALTIYRPTPGNPNSLASPFVYSVLEDGEGMTWVGTRNAGLDRLDRRTGEVRHFPPEPGIPDRLGWPAIEDIQQDRTGALWLAAYGGGLYRRDPTSGAFTLYRHDAADPRSLSDNNVRKLSFDESGALWIATTGGGLNRLDPATGAFTAYRADPNDPHALANDLTVGLEADHHGGVWVGTAGSGLQRLDVASGQFTTYHHDPKNPNSLTEDNVFAVHVDRAGVVWAGTQGGGLDAFDPLTGSFTHYHEQNGLPSERVQAIVEDGSPTDQTAGNLWIVTDRGLARLDQDRRTLQNYDSSNGFPRAQFTMGAFLDRKGEVLVASLAGLVAFDPSAFVREANPPPVVLTDFRVDNKPADRNVLPQAIDSTNSIQLSYAQRVISFEFSALSYNDPLKNHYRYKLDGFDSDWTEVDATRRVATYTNLQPGSYVFRVTGSNADEVWSDTGQAITFVVTPPWWEMWWLRAAAAAVLICALAAAYLWRERAAVLQRHHLERLVGERTRALEVALDTRDVFLRSVAHDLKRPVANLRWQAEVLSRRTRQDAVDPVVVLDSVTAITASADEVSATIDELRDLTMLAAGENLPLHREILDLVTLARSRVDLRATGSSEQFRFDSAVSGLLVDVDRPRLTRVIDNVLDNAAKYSPRERPVEVGVSGETRQGEQCAVLSVRDYGIGIPAADLPHIFEQYHRGGNVGSTSGEGLGLASARQLIMLHGGSIEVDSKEGVGSVFTLILPLASGTSGKAD